MVDKSLQAVNDTLVPKGGTNLADPASYNDDFNDLETLINDMKAYRGDAALPAGNKAIGKYFDAADVMTTCTCNNRTFVDAVDCSGRTACSCDLRTLSCSCDIRTTSCSCDLRTLSCSCNLRTTSCSCNSRTQDCACNLRNSTICHCATRAWCNCQNRGSCNCVSRGVCNCDARGTCNCDSRGVCDCDARTGCSCNSRTGEPLDIFS